ncbi:hypothetical protein [Amycolatopsis japonica]
MFFRPAAATVLATIAGPPFLVQSVLAMASSLFASIRWSWASSALLVLRVTASSAMNSFTTDAVRNLSEPLSSITCSPAARSKTTVATRLSGAGRLSATDWKIT